MIERIIHINCGSIFFTEAELRSFPKFKSCASLDINKPAILIQVKRSRSKLEGPKERFVNEEIKAELYRRFGLIARLKGVTGENKAGNLRSFSRIPGFGSPQGRKLKPNP